MRFSTNHTNLDDDDNASSCSLSHNITTKLLSENTIPIPFFFENEHNNCVGREETIIIDMGNTNSSSATNVPVGVSDKDNTPINHKDEDARIKNDKEDTKINNNAENTRKMMDAKDLKMKNDNDNDPEQPIIITNAVLVVDDNDIDVENNINPMESPAVDPMFNQPTTTTTTTTTATTTNGLALNNTDANTSMTQTSIISTYPSPNNNKPTTPNTSTITTNMTIPNGSQLMIPVATNSNTAIFFSPIIYNSLGRNSQGLICPHCHRQTITVTRDYTGVGTIAAVVLIAVFFWPLCWIPFCIPSCHRTHHYCGQPTCQKKIGETEACA